MGDRTRRSPPTSARRWCWWCTAGAVIRRRSPPPSSWPLPNSSAGTRTRWRRSPTGSTPPTCRRFGRCWPGRGWRSGRCRRSRCWSRRRSRTCSRPAAPNWCAAIPSCCSKESMGFVVAAMSLPNVLTRLREGYTVIAPGDRSDVLPALILAHQSATFPNLSSIVLTGGYTPAGFGAAADRRGAAGPADPGHTGRHLRDGVHARRRPRPADRRFHA